MRSGFAGIIGRPNVGKSTLLNCILGEKISITTDKPQTTRNVIRGIYTKCEEEGGVQIIFIDTPGIHKPRTKLGGYMTEAAKNTFREVDVIILIVDDALSAGTGDKYILELLKGVKTPKILAINKIDIIDPEKFKKIYEEYKELEIFDHIYGISAAQGKNVGLLTETIISYLNEGPMYYEDDIATDQPQKFIAAEIIREKILMYIEEEVPHGVAVEIESFRELKDITEISAVIYCEKKSHKGIIIGKDGKKLKGIGKSARIDIESLLGVKVFLNLWVKVSENWRDSDYALSNLGYYER